MGNKKPPLPSSAYLTLGGGLGDVFCNYFRGENGWGWLRPVKKKHPKLKIKVLSSTHSPQSLELIKYNPYISSMKEYGWTLDGSEVWNKYAGKAVRLASTRQLYDGLDPEPPKLYISNLDKKVVDKIRLAGDFVFIHPFAGLKDREALPVPEYIPLIDQLIDDYGLNVVVIGATHTRRNIKKSHEMLEVFDYQRPGLFNLVNKTNARVAMRLAQLANSFIGNWSAFSCAFWVIEGKTTVLTTPNKLDMLTKRFQKGQRWHKHGDCGIVCVGADESYNSIRDQILERYKKP